MHSVNWYVIKEIKERCYGIISDTASGFYQTGACYCCGRTYCEEIKTFCEHKFITYTVPTKNCIVFWNEEEV